MRYLMFLLALVAVTVPSFAQEQPTPTPTPTYYTITNEETGEIRLVEESQLVQEMDSFSQTAQANGAYYDAEGYLVIPMSQESQDIQSMQAALESETEEPAREGDSNYAWRQQWGNDTFGAEAFLTIVNTANKEAFTYNAGAGVKAKVFGKEFKIVEVTSDCNAATGVGQGNSPSTTGTTKVIFLNKVVFEKTNPTLEYEWAQNDLTIFQFKKQFMVGPVPVNVTATFTGMYGVKFTAMVAVGAIMAAVKPYGGIDFAFEAAAGISGVLSVGVGGQLRLIYLEIRAGGSIALASITSFRVYASIDADLKSLSGNVYVYVELLFKKFKLTIASWNGIVKSWTLWAYDRTFDF